jgi:hypothetical protein
MNLAFKPDFSRVLAKHSKYLSLEHTLSIGVGRMQPNFEPMRQQVETWRGQQFKTGSARSKTRWRLVANGVLTVSFVTRCDPSWWAVAVNSLARRRREGLEYFY